MFCTGCQWNGDHSNQRLMRCLLLLMNPHNRATMIGAMLIFVQTRGQISKRHPILVFVVLSLWCRPGVTFYRCPRDVCLPFGDHLYCPARGCAGSRAGCFRHPSAARVPPTINRAFKAPTGLRFEQGHSCLPAERAHPRIGYCIKHINLLP